MKRRGFINETLIFTVPIAILLGLITGITTHFGYIKLTWCIWGLSFIIIVGFPVWNEFQRRIFHRGIQDFFNREFAELAAIQTKEDANQYLVRKSQGLEGGIGEAKLHAYWTSNRLEEKERKRLQDLLEIEENYGEKYLRLDRQP